MTTKPAEKSEWPLVSDRFEPVRMVDGGAWGKVWQVKDKYHSNGRPSYLAIKVLEPTELAHGQMEERDLREADVIDKEHRFGSARHVLPGWSDRDQNGTGYIAMPYCENGNLENRLGSNGEVITKQDEKNALGIARGVEELHSIYDRVHGDLKPANIMIDDSGEPVLTDLGTSSMASPNYWSQSQRSNMGEIQTRARELFNKDSHPNKRTDTYSTAALIYRIFTGKYPFQDHFSNQTEAEDFFATKSEGELKKIIREGARGLPKRVRRFLERGLSPDEYDRFYDGSNLRTSLEGALTETPLMDKINDALRSSAARIGIPIALATVGYLFGMSHYRGADLMEDRAPLKGTLYLPQGPEDPVVKFDTEHIRDLPKINRGWMVDSKGIDRIALKETDGDRTKAHIVASYRRMLDHNGHSRFTEEQVKTYLSENKIPIMAAKISQDHLRGKNPFEIVAPNVDRAMRLAYNSDKKEVDLEDLCTIARLGPGIVDRAKRASNSHKFVDYTKAKDISGKLIIPEDETELIKIWLAYIHDNI